jgi:hypothetical protein
MCSELLLEFHNFELHIWYFTLSAAVVMRLLRCQAQLELTLMMCLGDRSTFTSTGALSGRHDGSSPLFFLEDLLSSQGVCVCKSSSSLPPNLFMVLEPGTGYGLSNKHKKQRRRYGGKRSSSLPPSCSLLHPCRSSLGGTGKRHRIEELSSPRQSYKDCIMFFGRNFGAEITFQHHLDLRFWVSRRSCAIQTTCQMTSIKLFDAPPSSLLNPKKVQLC